jgi:hypothetical protein
MVVLVEHLREVAVEEPMRQELVGMVVPEVRLVVEAVAVERDRIRTAVMAVMAEMHKSLSGCTDEMA